MIDFLKAFFGAIVTLQVLLLLLFATAKAFMVAPMLVMLAPAVILFFLVVLYE